MKRGFSLLLAPIFLICCNTTSDKTAATSGNNDSIIDSSSHTIPYQTQQDTTHVLSVDTTKSENRQKHQQSEDVNQLTEQNASNTINLKIQNNEGKVTVNKKAAQNLYFVFNSGKAKELDLTVTPQYDTANIRITQIFPPKGDADGPFGRQTNYPIHASGSYTVRVSESLMEGTPYSGKVTFEVRLK